MEYKEGPVESYIHIKCPYCQSITPTRRDEAKNWKCEECSEKAYIASVTRTKDQLIHAFRIIENQGDEEGGHILADKLLCAYIGDRDIEKAFESIPKWYA